MINSRVLIAAALLTGAAVSMSAMPAAAQAWPNKPVKVLVGFAPGGPTDVMARLLSQKIGESLSQQFVVENRPGAGGNISMGIAAKSPPDGYTILFTSSAFVVNPSLYRSIPYDPYKDFVPVTKAGTSPNVMVVNPAVPAKTPKELIEVIRANPGKYSFATAGMGTTPDLAGELFRMTYNLDAVRVPFNGAAPAFASTLANQTPIAFGALPPAAEMIKAGQLRPLAVAANHRSPMIPDVPTMAEAGIPDQESDTWQGVFLPAGTPRPIVDQLYREVLKALAQPDVKQRLGEIGFEAIGNTPEQFTQNIKDEIQKWAKVIKAANIKVE